MPSFCLQDKAVPPNLRWWENLPSGWQKRGGRLPPAVTSDPQCLPLVGVYSQGALGGGGTTARGPGIWPVRVKDTTSKCQWNLRQNPKLKMATIVTSSHQMKINMKLSLFSSSRHFKSYVNKHTFAWIGLPCHEKIIITEIYKFLS